MSLAPITGSAALMDAGHLRREEHAVNALRRLADGVGVALLGLFLMATVHHTAAGHGLKSPSSGRPPPPDMQQPSLPSAGRPFNAPPAFLDRSTPISERPFAKPFSDRSPPMAERPLSPIGGGHPSSRDVAPQVWCQGRWMRADQLWRDCPSW